MILNICEQSLFLSVIYFIKSIIQIISLVVPLLLIIFLSIELYKIVIGKTERINNHIKSIIGKIFAAVIIFFLPLIIGLVISFASGTKYQDSNCWNNANKDTIKKYREIEKAKEKEEKEKLEEESKKAKEEREKTAAEREEKRKEKEEEAEDAKREGEKEPINLVSSFKKYNDNTYSLFVGYYLYIPKNATTKMPLIVMFPPNSYAAPDMVKIAETKSLDNLKAFIYVPILVGTGTTEKRDWNMSASGQAVKKINDLVKEYKLDSNRISLTAFSSSGYYIYQTANDYRIFSAIAPMSSGVQFDTIKNYYKNWQYLKTLPIKGYGEKGGRFSGDGKTNCDSIGSVSWSAKQAMCTVVEGLGKCSNCEKDCDAFTYIPEACHGNLGKYVFSIDEDKNGVSDIFDWMIAQEKK